MAEKRNKFKNKNNAEAGPSEVKAPFSERLGAALNRLKNERLHKIAGLFFLLFSVFLLFAFISYLFTWKADQDKLLSSGTEFFFNKDVQVNNWLGKTGALLSHYFIYSAFGFASFIFAPLFFLFGFRILFKISLLPLKKTTIYAFFTILWISAVSGFAVTENSIFGGAFGFHANIWLTGIFGKAGAGLLLLFSLMCFLIAAFNISFDFLKPSPKGEEAPEAEEIELPINKLKAEQEEELKDNEMEFTLNGKEIDINKAIEKPLAPEPLIPAAPEPELLADLSFEVQQNNEPAVEMTQEQIEEKLAESGEYDPTLDLSSYKFPTIDLLEKYGNNTIQVNKEELEANKDRILDTLKNYGIEIAKIKATIGPTVTLYEIIPEAGVRISKIKNLEDDIALSLSALGIRIIAPIPGKGTIGIEVPNQHAEVVPMRSLIASDKFQSTEMELPIALGKTISNETFIADLAKMPHLLMAGATGQGKSVGLNAILVSLLYKKHPSQIKFVLVDPKKVELTLYNKIERHFLAKLPDCEEPIITDNKKVIHTLNSLCIEMDNRYELLKNAGVRNLKEYNAKFISRRLNPNEGHHYLPYIVLVVDEFADLIMTAGKEVETPIARLAQLARAIGIHLIIATQRPSVNIITGTIKANFPARIAFRVTSKIDSRTILDSGGADQLIGRGDMLLSTGNDLIRIQCAFVDTPEVEKICEFIGEQRGYPSAFLLPEFTGADGEEGGKDFDASDRDSMFEDAARIVVQHQQGSASLLQRRLKLGYNRAGRIIDQLEAAGVIGPFEGSKARQVLITDEASLEQFLNSM